MYKDPIDFSNTLFDGYVNQIGKCGLSRNAPLLYVEEQFFVTIYRFSALLKFGF